MLCRAPEAKKKMREKLAPSTTKKNEDENEERQKRNRKGEKNLEEQ